MKKYDYVDWFCDSCDANLNRQPGFTTASGTWICTECGAVNDVTDDNILDEDDETYQEECPNCGGHMRRMTYSPGDAWVCEDCGLEGSKDDYGIMWADNDFFDDEYETEEVSNDED